GHLHLKTSFALGTPSVSNIGHFRDTCRVKHPSLHRHLQCQLSVPLGTPSVSNIHK
ncbi:hypothetical protein SK128_003884, partial [Halocaridina rubra]